MSDEGKIKVKKRIKVRKKVSKKKTSRIRKWKKASHQILVFLMIIFSALAFYLLFWGLIIEPNLPRHIYGQGDFKETIALLVSLLIIAISYLFIIIIKYKPLSFEWWQNAKLFYLVRFDLDKYSALRQMGIGYRHRVKKTKRSKHAHSHKSITEE